MYRSLFAFVVLLGIAASATGQDKTPLPRKELIQYMRDARKAGMGVGEIQQNLIKAGWDPKDIAAAISAPPKESAAPADVSELVNAGAKSLLKQGESGKPGGPLPPLVKPQSDTLAADDIAIGNHDISDEYAVGEGDVLQIHVWNEPAASVANVVVRPDGMITVPLVHQIQVARLTPSQIEKLLTEKLQEFDTAITPASVTVVVSQINSKKIYMTGALKREGPIPYTYRMTVMQAISEAGGLTEFAKPKDIYVLRLENGKQHQFQFNYRAVLKGQHIESNIQLRPGDTVVVPN
jgi:polysaccharide export outer membrane protein